MENHQKEIHISGIDTRALSTLIIELNIARRNCSSYPEGHPVIDSSLRKALDIYTRLLEPRQEIIIGVTRDALMVEDVYLEKSNPVYRDFAAILFDHGIGALVLHSGMTIDELKNFTGILNLKRENIFNNGGIDSIWNSANITAIDVRAVRYDLFSTIEKDTVGGTSPEPQAEDLWERFARGVTRGLLNQEGSSESELDPELLASILNGQYKMAPEQQQDYARTITSFMHQDEILHLAETQSLDHYYEKLAAFVGKMNPDLRRQFLNSAFDMRSPGKELLSEKFVSRSSTDTVVELLDEVNRCHVAVPPVIMGLLQRLGRHSTPSRQILDTEVPDREDLCRKMRSIFREHASEEFIPDEYQCKLNRIIESDEIPFLGHEELHDMMGTLDTDAIEGHISDILLLLVMEDPLAEGTSNLVESLNDMCNYFLQTGDYLQLNRIMLRTGNERIPFDLRRNFREYFSRREFMEEVLNGLHTWGKSKYEEIRMIILEIGEPFIEILLDRLAEEESMSLRRFLMDRIQEFGQAAIAPIIGRLTDNRWYFLRNLILMIRAIGDLTHRERLRPLARHSNQRVRQETLKTLLHFRDSVAEQQVLQDMDDDDLEIRKMAIHLAEKNPSQKIFNKVLSFLAKPGLSAREYELKCAAVQSLAEIGKEEALPSLSKVLESRNILHPVLLTRLKLEIVRSLERYPVHSARQVLKRLSAGKDRLAQQAEQSLRSIAGQ
jgi:hypothetical protein